MVIVFGGRDRDRRRRWRCRRVLDLEGEAGVARAVGVGGRREDQAPGGDVGQA